MGGRQERAHELRGARTTAHATDDDGRQDCRGRASSSSGRATTTGGTDDARRDDDGRDDDGRHERAARSDGRELRAPLAAAGATAPRRHLAGWPPSRMASEHPFGRTPVRLATWRANRRSGRRGRAAGAPLVLVLLAAGLSDFPY